MSDSTFQRDDEPRGSILQPPAKPGSVVFSEPSFCPVCGFELTGRPQLGQCPDCGRAYRPGSVTPRRAPSTVAILVRFIWPVAVWASGMLTMQYLSQGGVGLSRDAEAIVNVLIAAGAMGFLINLPVQMLWWRRVRGLPSREPKVLRLGAIVIVSLVSAVFLVPFLLVGACLVIML